MELSFGLRSQYEESYIYIIVSSYYDLVIFVVTDKYLINSGSQCATKPSENLDILLFVIYYKCAAILLSLKSSHFKTFINTLPCCITEPTISLLAWHNLQCSNVLILL